MSEKQNDKVFIKYSEILPVVLEAVIDSRYKYLKELDYDNYNYARTILEKEYNPAVKKLQQILEVLS